MIKPEEQVNITNSQRVKYFSWHVSTLFKDLRLVVSIQTNHTFTSFNSIDRLFFSYKVFPHWAHDSSVVGVSVVGCLYSVQYKSIFGMPDKVRCNTCDKAKPLSQIWGVEPNTSLGYELAKPTHHHHLIAGLQDCIPTKAFGTGQTAESDLMVISICLFSLGLARLLLIRFS